MSTGRSPLVLGRRGGMAASALWACGRGGFGPTGAWWPQVRGGEWRRRDVAGLLGCRCEAPSHPPFTNEVPSSESSDLVSGSSNGDVLGRCIVLGGVAFGALV